VAEYALPIALAFFGFIALAAILLVPIARFLKREEERAEEWTERRLAERRRAEAPPGDGAPGQAPSDGPSAGTGG